jgi:hypothetical protein
VNEAPANHIYVFYGADFSIMGCAPKGTGNSIRLQTQDSSAAMCISIVLPMSTVVRGSI